MIQPSTAVLETAQPGGETVNKSADFDGKLLAL
jgi:hypothetical protein